MSGEGGEGEGKLPSVDHGRRTDRGRDKNIQLKVNSLCDTLKYPNKQAQMCAEGCEGVHFSKFFFSKQAFGQISFGC